MTGGFVSSHLSSAFSFISVSMWLIKDLHMFYNNNINNNYNDNNIDNNNYYY